MFRAFEIEFDKKFGYESGFHMGSIHEKIEAENSCYISFKGKPGSGGSFQEELTQQPRGLHSNSSQVSPTGDQESACGILTRLLDSYRTERYYTYSTYTGIIRFIRCWVVTRVSP
jgi:hypothetical protein